MKATEIFSNLPSEKKYGVNILYLGKKDRRPSRAIFCSGHETHSHIPRYGYWHLGIESDSVVRPRSVMRGMRLKAVSPLART